MQSLTKQQEQLVAKHIVFAESLAQKIGQRVASDLSELCIDMDDLKQESLLGLCEAAIRFDPKVGTNFRTLAYYYCRRYVLLAIRKYGVPVSVPNNFTATVQSVRLDWVGCDGDVEDNVVAGRLGLPTMEADGDDRGIEATEARGLIDELSLRADREAALQEAQEQLVAQWLSRLSPRDQLITRLAFGLDCEPLSYQAVGQQVGLTSTRVSQILKAVGADGRGGGGRAAANGAGGRVAGADGRGGGGRAAVNGAGGADGAGGRRTPIRTVALSTLDSRL